MMFRISILLAVVITSACTPENNGPTGSIAPQITFVSKGAAGSTATSDNLRSKVVNFGGASLPADLNTVRVSVSGPFTGSPISQDFAASARTGTVNGVPEGTGNTLTVLGLDSGNVTRYQSVTNNISVTAGTTNTVNVVAVGTSPIVDGFARYIDVNNSSTINAGDQIRVRFDQDVQLATTPTIADFSLPVTSDSFGAGATVAAGIDAKEVVITLGTSPVLNVQTVYDGTTTAGAASGIDVSTSVTGISATVVDNTLAAPSTPIDIVGSFTANYGAGTAVSANTDVTRDIAMGDLNGDGVLDMFVANASTAQASRVLLGVNDGSGTFTDTLQTLGTSDVSTAVVLGDIDADGDLDAVVANDGLTTKAYINDGSANFTLNTSLTSATNWSSVDVALGDLNNDGYLDLVEVIDNTYSYFYLNDGSGDFGSSISSNRLLTTTTSGSTSVALGDVNGDGAIDIVLGRNSGVTSQIFLNSGSGTFTDSGQSLGTLNTQDVALGDIDGDGDLDAVLANISSAGNQVFKNNGSGGFNDTTQSLGAANSYGVALADIDGDGDLDAIFANGSANQVYLNDGSGDFSALGQALGSTGTTYSVAVGDIQNDGDLDFVFSNSGATNDIYLNAQPNIPPTANAGADQTVAAGDTITFAGTASDTDGTIATTVWSHVSGTVLTLSDSSVLAPTAVAPTFSVDTTAVYRLTVTDNSGDTATDTVTINITGNVAPTAHAGVAQTVQTGSVVYFDGFGTDPDGSIASFSWSQLSGAPVSILSDGTTSARFVAPVVTTNTPLTFRLTVTDDAGATGTADVIFTIAPAANVPPTANAGVNQTVASATTTVSLSGFGTDIEGAISGYLWEQTAGQSVTLANSTSATATFTAPTVTADETLTFRLTVTDSGGAAASDTVDVTVSATANVPPTADAGSDQTTVVNGDTVSLSGVSSDDGSVASESWVQISGTAVTLNGANSNVATFTAPGVNEVLGFRFIVEDDLGAITTDDVLITITNSSNVPPTAFAGVDRAVSSGDFVTVIGAGDDTDGTFTSEWTVVSQPSTPSAFVSTTSTGDTLTFTAPSVSSDETLVLRLTVTDNASATATDDITITIKAAANTNPTVNAGLNDTVQSGRIAELKAFATDDGTIAGYSWTQIGGRPVVLTTPNSSTASFTAPLVTTDETFTFRVSATDDGGAVATDDVVITVTTTANIRPNPNAGVDQLVTSASTVTLYGGGADRDGNIASYSWLQTSGTAVVLSSASAQAPTFTAPTVTGADEVLTFRLTVTDNDGAIRSDDVTITVTATTGTAPVVDAGVAQTASFGTDVTLNGTATDDGTVASYQWTQVSGPFVVLFNSNSATATFVAPTLQVLSSQLTFRLTVTDDIGFIGTDEVIVTASSVVNVAPVANAGVDQTVQISSTVTLDSSASSDSDGNIASRLWTQIAGTPQTLSDATAIAPTFTAPGTNESFTFRLTVTDNDDAVSIDDVVITVSDLPFVIGKARYLDKDFDGTVNNGDQVILAFNKNIVTTSATISDLSLPVSGDNFGSGATVTSLASSNEAIITLGTSPSLRINGVYSGDTTNAPSGIAVSATNAGIEGPGSTFAAASAPVDIIPAYVDSTQTLGTANTTGLVLGDIDSDGDLDLVDAVNGATTSTFYTNDGTGTLTLSQFYSGGTFAMNGIALGDIDGDFDLDIVIANGGTEANRYYQYNGTSFLQNAQQLGAADSKAVALADLNGDGDLDAVFANNGANSIYFNTGSGLPATASSTFGTSNSSAVAIGDIDKDGDLDIVVANAVFQANKVYTNNGSGTFTDSTQTLGAGDSKGIALSDINGDGSLDIIVANTSGGNKVYTNNGSGTFTDSLQSLGSSSSVAVTVADTNNDSKPDLIFANNGTAGNTVFVNDGSGVFTDSTQVIGGNDSRAVVVGDLDGDGDQDLVFANNTSQANRVYFNSVPKAAIVKGQARYLDTDLDGSVNINDQIVIPFSQDVSGASATLSDFNLPVSGDSFGTGAVVSSGPAANEMTITLGTSPSLTLLLNYTGTNTTGSPSGIDVSVSNLNILTATANGEAAIASTPVDIMPAYLQASQTFGAGTDSKAVAFGDLNNDGKQDMVIANNGGNQIFFADGGNGFTDSTQSPLGSSDSVAVALGDVNGDGYLDIAFANAGTQSNTVWINAGAGNPGLFANAGLSIGAGATDVVLADINGDAAVDLLLAYSGAQNTYYLNVSGSYSASTLFGTTAATVAIATGDIDGDGDIDVVQASTNGPIQVFRSDGLTTPGFGTFNQGNTLTSATDLKLGDVDSDGDLDIVVSRIAGNGNLVYINNTVTTPVFNDSLQSLGTNNSTGVVLVDMDGDADLDLVFSNDNDTGNTVYINDGSGKYSDSGISLGSENSNGLAIADIDGDGGKDIAVVNGGILPNNIYFNSTPTYVAAAPVFTSGTTSSVDEGTTDTGYTATATDTNPGDVPTFSITGGADAADFVINSTTGVLSFGTASDFENPVDSDTNNVYVVEITASDIATPTVQTVTVTVIDLLEVTVSTADPKTVQFDWATVAGALSYKLFVNPDGASGFTLQTDGIPSNTTNLTLPVHLTDWVNATYKVEAHDGSGLLMSSNAFSITSEMLNAIGYFKASNTGTSDQFGYELSLSSDGNTLAVGAYAEDGNAGGINPTETGSLTDTGAVYVFIKTGTTWTQQALIKPTILSSSSQFGEAVSISADGNTLAVGARYEDTTATNSGAVYIFKRSTGVWTQDQLIKAANAGANDYFGEAVSLSNDGSTLAVGAYSEGSNSLGINSTPNDFLTGVGAAYVFIDNGTSWVQQAYIKPDVSPTASEYFGWDVSLSADGDTLAVGSQREDSNQRAISATGTTNNSGTDSGAVYVFTRDISDVWTQQAYIKSNNSDVSDYFGTSVSLSGDGNTLAVGAWGEDGNAPGINPTETGSISNSGAAYVFTRVGTTWSQQAYVKASTVGSSDYFGEGLDLSADGNTLAVGSRLEDGGSQATLGINGLETDNSITNAGAVYVYQFDGTDWAQKAFVKQSSAPSTSEYFGYFGISLSSDGSSLAVGAGSEDSNATDVGGDASNNSFTDSGAVFLY